LGHRLRQIRPNDAAISILVCLLHSTRRGFRRATKGIETMAKASGESLEKLEDMIVRAAESTAAHVRAAKAAIGAVIFGQDLVIERALVTVLSGGHGLLVGVPGLA